MAEAHLATTDLLWFLNAQLVLAVFAVVVAADVAAVVVTSRSSCFSSTYTELSTAAAHQLLHADPESNAGPSFALEKKRSEKLYKPTHGLACTQDPALGLHSTHAV